MRRKHPALGGCRDRLWEAERLVRQVNQAAKQIALVGEGRTHADKYHREALERRSRVLASNVVHQLRSTLDNLVTALVVVNGGDPKRHNQFPVTLVDNHDGRKTFAWRLEGLSTLASQALWSVQPCHADEPTEHTLVKLNELWNVDKHRLLNTVTAVPALVTINSQRELPGFQIEYEDGTVVVPFLRYAVAYVSELVIGVEPVLFGLPAALLLDPAIIEAEATALQARDPAGTYLHRLEQLAGRDWTVEEEIPDSELHEALANVVVLRTDPDLARHHEHWLAPLEIYLSRRLIGLDDRD